MEQAKSQVRLAQMEIAANHLPRAAELLTSATALAPEWLVPREWLALVYQRQSNKDQALAQYAWLQRKTLDFDLAGRCNPAGCADLVLSSEALTLWLVNDQRQQAGLPVLRVDPELSVVARGHSLEMAARNYFSHISRTQNLAEPMDRFKQAFCFLPNLLAENIARRWGSQPCLTLENIAATHVDFMNSPGHRDNILRPGVDVLGVGVATDPRGAYWVTEEFAHWEPTAPADTSWNSR